MRVFKTIRSSRKVKDLCEEVAVLPGGTGSCYHQQAKEFQTKTQDADPGWLPFCTDLSFSSLWLFTEAKLVPKCMSFVRISNEYPK